jgi:peptidyl-prolyl cis-trans isomerase B (cyclophilin B)
MDAFGPDNLQKTIQSVTFLRSRRQSALSVMTFLWIAITLGMLSACHKFTDSNSKQENQYVSNNNEVAIIKTSAGEMVIEFWSDVAPNTVANFIKLAKDGFYDGTAFHRIVKGFMIQGGDPLTKDPAMEDRWGTGDPGYKIKAEFNDRLHDRGVLSMARSNDPDSAGSQFFICLGRTEFLDGKYTAFGTVLKGDEVLGALGDVETISNRGEKSKPVERQAVESIKIVSRDSLE